MPDDLPPPRTPGSYRLAVVCLGNICRSPMAHVVLEDLLAEAGLADRVRIASAGTGDWHVGQPMDRRAAALLTAHGYDASRHRARQFERSWHEEQDLVLAMDATNLADLRQLASRIAGDPDRLRLFRSFDPLAGADEQDVPDPYYGDEEGFEEALAIIRRTSRGIVDALRAALGAAPPPGQ